jgi:WD40 repeat protein
MISVASNVFFIENYSKPIFVKWLENNSIILAESNNSYSLIEHGKISKKSIQRENSLVLALESSFLKDRVFVLAKKQLDVYDVNQVNTFSSYTVEGLPQKVVTFIYSNYGLIIIDANSNIFTCKDMSKWQITGCLQIKNPTCGCYLRENLYVFGSGYGDIEIVDLALLETYITRRIHADSIQDLITDYYGNIFAVSRDKSISSLVFDGDLHHNWLISNASKHFINCITIVNNQIWMGSSDGIIKIINILNREEIFSFQLHDDAIRKIVLSPDHSRIASISDDGTCKIVSTTNFEIERKYGESKSYILSADIQFYPAGFNIIVGKSNGEVLLFDESKKGSQILYQAPTEVRSIRFCADKEYICGLKDGSLEKWNFGGKLSFDSSSQESIYSITVDLSSQRIWCGRANGYIGIYNLSDLRLIDRKQVHQSIIGDIISNDRNHLFTCSDDQTIRVVSKEHLLTIKTSSIESAAINNLLVVSNIVLATTDDNKILILDRTSHTIKNIYEEHNEPIRAICQIDSDLIASGDRNGWLHVWSLESLKMIWIIKLSGRVVKLAFNKETNILVGVTENEIHAFKVNELIINSKSILRNIKKMSEQKNTIQSETKSDESAQVPIPLNVFISYSHKDEDLREELDIHLSNLKRQGKIKAWHDRAIEAGAEWETAIKEQLETAAIILLLISPRFMASDYCYDLEMERAMQRHDKGTARVIPIILKPVDWTNTPFSKLQALPKDGQPITSSSWNDRDTAFLDVVQGIRRAIDSLQK